MFSKDSHCQSLLLKVSRPIHSILAIFIAAPPPCLTFDLKRNKNKTTRCLLYATYILLLLSLTIWMSYENKLISINYLQNADLGSLTNVLTAAQSMTVFLVQAINQLVMLFRFKQLQHIFIDIEKIEHDIIWNSMSQRMGAGKSACYVEKSFRWQLLRKSGCMLVYTGTIHTLTNIFLAAPLMPISYRVFTALSLILIQMKNVEFCLMIQLVHELLRLLFDEMLYVRKQFIETVNLADRRALYAALKHNQNCLSRIWNLVDIISSYYALPLLALFLYDGFAITATVNWAFVMQAAGDLPNTIPREYRFLFTTNLLINMMVPCWLCQCCKELYDRFAVVLHDLGSNGRDIRLSLCLREYSLQLMHQKLQFTCNGFFDINLKHFGARILTIMTYVVILVQFRLQAEAEKELEAAKQEAADLAKSLLSK